jgi:amino acid adenylation domain-containing protein
MEMGKANQISGRRVEFGLTPLQLGMVYESALAGQPWVNLEQVVVHLDDEEIDPSALRAAWIAVAKRHDALRLSILWRKRVSPVQVIHPEMSVDLPVEDWSALNPKRQTLALERFLTADRERGVDLEAAPSWRVQMIRLGARRSVMIWTVHHAMVDGRSIAIVLEDLFAELAQPTTSAQSGGMVASFSDYCFALSKGSSPETAAHFKTYLDGFDQPNDLATTEDLSEPSTLGRKIQIERRLEADLTEALTNRAEAAGATLANVIHAVWGMVVARWTGRDDAVFGVTRAGRHLLAGSDRTVGCLINTIPLKVQAGAGRQSDDLLAQLRRDALAMRPHEHASLTDIRRWCGLTGTVSMFDSMVMFERNSLEQTMRQRGKGWENRRVTLREEGALPVTLAVYADRRMLIALEYAPSSIPAQKAGALLTHFVELLASFAKSEPGTPLEHLTMLPRWEEAALLAKGRPERKLPPALPCLATRYEQAALAYGGRAALSMVGHGAGLTHTALDARANGLAHALVAHGAGPGVIVAICLDRSPEFIVAMLATLKAGAAFLPIDPSYPAAVIAHMLADSGTRLMISAPQAAPPPHITLISPDAQAQQMPPPRPAPDPERLAYVIYTSGSTGAPKGVRVPMRAVSAHASAISAEFALTPEDKVLQFASLSFDVAIEEVIPTLLSGAHLILRDAQMAGAVPDFLDAVQAQGITVLNLPTAFWHVLVDDMARNTRSLPPHVRLVIVGGEQISPRALATWQRIAPGPRWLNGYGPTEATITCTLHEPGPLAPGEDIPIGRPTAHARAYVLAADGSLAPMGTAGELWIGGLAVSDGYIGRDDETAKAFRRDRFAGQGRMYRTGDRARWRKDGTLAFLGRRDRQVKIRGFRVDLRHVERVLERDASVGRAVARVLEKGTPGARLAAWVAGAEGHGTPDAAALRDTMAGQLPPHMMPAIVAIDEFPRTPGGKIDMEALPLPDRVTSSVTTTEAADPTTRRVAELMARVLGLDQIGPDDSFHDLGGHSLLAVQLIGRIEADLGHRLGVADLHHCPTPKALAAAVDAAQSGPRYIIPIQPNGSKPPLFGVHVLGRNEEYYRPLARALGPDQPFFGLSVGLLTQDTPIGVEETAKRYFEDIQQHHPKGPVSLAAVSLGSYIAFDLAQQLLAAGRDVRMLALFDAEGPGGRSRLRGSARFAAHIRRARHEGAAYLLHILSNRLVNLRNSVEKLRLRAATQKGEASPMTIGSFVAANELAVEAYEAQPIDLPLTIFRAEENIFDSPESRAEGLGWAPVAEAGFQVFDVPGDHLSILAPPNVETLAVHMAKVLADPSAGD